MTEINMSGKSGKIDNRGKKERKRERERDIRIINFSRGRDVSRGVFSENSRLHCTAAAAAAAATSSQQSVGRFSTPAAAAATTTVCTYERERERKTGGWLVGTCMQKVA